MAQKLSQINGGIATQYVPATDAMVAVRGLGGTPTDQLVTGVLSSANPVATGLAAPAVALGDGAGAGATKTLAGKDMAGTLQVITAGSPAANSNIAVVTSNVAAPNGSSIVITPADAATAAAIAASSIYAVGSTTGWTLACGAVALTTGHTLNFNYHWIGF